MIRNQVVSLVRNTLVTLNRNQVVNLSGISTEAKKLQFLEACGMPWHDQLKSLFKYLSQYQHFSPRTYDLLSYHIKQDITCYQHILGLLMALIGQLFPVLELKGKSDLERQLSLLGKSMIESFNE